MDDIDGVIIKQLKINSDERGYLMEILRNDDENYIEFGQAYISSCYPGVIKAWHCHEKQTDHFCCIEGNALVALHDDREDSPTYENVFHSVIGLLNPVLIIIPPGVWHGMAAIGGEKSVMLNIPDVPYNRDKPDELRAPLYRYGNGIFESLW